MIQNIKKWSVVSKKINNIDILRAVAIIAVFSQHLFHVYKIPIPFFGQHGGWFGVELFFLISGYLIIQSAEKHSMKAYVIHRVFRIYPAYLLVFLVFGVLTGMCSVQRISNNSGDFMLNMVLMQHLFPKALMTFDILHVSWTLTVEVLWYVLAPLLVIPFKKYSLQTLVLSFLFSTIWVKLCTAGKLDFIYLKTFQDMGANIPAMKFLVMNNSFFGQLCFFFIGAFIYQNRERLIRVNTLVLVFVFSWVFYWPVIIGHFTNPNFISGIGIGALFIIALQTKVLESRILKFIADMSYSIYLVHFPVILHVYHNLKMQSLKGALLAIAITLLLSAVIYHTVEKPMMKYARSLSNPG